MQTSNNILLSCLCIDGKSFQLTMKKNDKFVNMHDEIKALWYSVQKTQQAYQKSPLFIKNNKSMVDIKSVKVLVDGINADNMTPEEYKLKNGDIIDIIIE